MALCQSPWTPPVRWRYPTPTARATCRIPAYPHYTDRAPQIMLMSDMASRTNTTGFCCTWKASDPTAGCPAAPDCAGGLDYRTQYRHTTLCTLRHRSCSSRCVRSMTSRAPPTSCFFGDLGDHLHSVRAGVAGARGGFSGDPAPKRGPRQRPGMGSRYGFIIIIYFSTIPQTHNSGAPGKLAAACAVPAGQAPSHRRGGRTRPSSARTFFFPMRPRESPAIAR